MKMLFLIIPLLFVVVACSERYADQLFIINAGTTSGNGSSDNSSWNQTYANTLYAPIAEPLWSGNATLVYPKSNPLGFYNISTLPASGGDNSSWNQTMANIIYIRNTTIPTCSGTDKLTSSGNGVFTCAADSTGAARSNIRVLNDQTTFNNTISVNVTNMHMILAANSKYRINCDIYYKTSVATTGLTVSLSANRTTRYTDYYMAKQGYVTQASATAVIPLTATTDLLNTALVGTGSSGANTTSTANLQAYIETLNSINLSLAYRSEIAGSTATIQNGTNCDYGVIT